MAHNLVNFLLYNPQKPLLFTQITFWLFFFIVYLGFAWVYKRHKPRNAWLFGVSLFFYYKSSGLFILLLGLSIIINHLIGLRLGRTINNKTRKMWVGLAVGYNLIWLLYFKYTYFIVGLFSQFTGIQIEVHDWVLESISRLTTNPLSFEAIVLPVGISFYTFQILSYVIDLYRKEVEPIKSIADFGFYVTFFPQLVAGPIVRASQFIPQMYQSFKLHRDEAAQGLFLILNGLIKKIIIADYISVNFVDRVFDTPSAYTGLENLLAIYGYSLQIYCDFSGYTDIAIGLALWMGFRLPLNFKSPYKADSITDFWRRWHISLSTWLKDYLYIPLGGNRKGKLRTYLNLVLTMLLGGLWHGASLRFIIWGALHGVYLGIHKGYKSLCPLSQSRWRFVWVFVTFNLVTFTWIAFRTPNLKAASDMFYQIMHQFNGTHFLSILAAHKTVLTILTVGYLIHWLPVKTKDWYRGRFILMPWYMLVLATVLVVFVLAQFKIAGLQPFIYFQF